MSPTFNPQPGSSWFFQDRILVSRHFQVLSVGDVVVLRDPSSDTPRKLVKRISAIQADQPRGGSALAQSENPGDLLFVEGDNKLHSTDSRNFGYVNRGLVEGVVSAIVFPPWRAKWIENDIA